MAENPTAFKENFHMNVETFQKMSAMLMPHLLPKRATRKDLISPNQKWAIVLEFLASGSVQRHVSSCYRISKQHFGTILDEVCNALIKELAFVVPKWNQTNMQEMARDFEQLWYFPNCVGVIDGKHVRIKRHKNSGSLFYNYKGFFSIVISAVSVRLTYLDVGTYGSEGDANIFRNSSLGKKILTDKLNFPLDSGMDESGEKLPFLAADDAFPLWEFSIID